MRSCSHYTQYSYKILFMFSIFIALPSEHSFLLPDTYSDRSCCKTVSEAFFIYLIFSVSMELLNAHLLVSLQIYIKTHFYITMKFFTLQCTYLFRRCFSCFLFQKIATKGAHLKISFQMRPFAFFFSVRSIRNAPSPLPRRPARRYRLRTLCTDPESHHVFQAQWCVRRTGTW